MATTTKSTLPRKIAFAVLGLIVLLILISFFLPNKFAVERNHGIRAPARVVFLYVGDITRWKDWTIWSELDPEMQFEYSEKPYGTDSQYRWTGSRAGDGSVRVTEFTAPKSVRYEISIPHWGEPMSAEISLEETAPGFTVVTWRILGPVSPNPLKRFLGLSANPLIGKDMEQSLVRLQKLAEATDPMTKAAWESTGK